MDRPKVPCCDDAISGRDQGCNGKLQRAFETPFQADVRRFWVNAFSASAVSGVAIRADERRGFGLWFVKTMMLLFHPKRRDWLADVRQDSGPWLPDVSDIFRWMVDSPLAGPSDVHLWVTTSKDTTQLARGQTLYQWQDLSGNWVEQRLFEITIAGLRFTLMYHPGGEVVLERAPGPQLWPFEPGDLGWAEVNQQVGSLRYLSVERLPTVEWLEGYDPISDPFSTPHDLMDLPPGAKSVIP